MTAVSTIAALRTRLGDNDGMPHTAARSPRHKLDVRTLMARILLTREVGQRIPTVQELQHTVQAGTGTVMRALRDLESSGSIALSSHGHQGTLLVTRDAGKLWNEARLGNFTMVMSPPGPVEQQGILESIQSSLGSHGVPVMTRSLAGARRRLEELYHERADAVVTSAAAFTRHQADFPGLAALPLGDHSFYSAGSLVVVESPDRHLGTPLRVGIDRGSFDHQQLTETEFSAAEVEFVQWQFVSAPAAVLLGRVDAAVWHAMPTVIPPQLAGLRVRPVTDRTLAETRDVTRAVIVTRGLDAGVNALMRDITPTDVAKTQTRLLKLAADAEHDFAEVWPR